MSRLLVGGLSAAAAVLALQGASWDGSMVSSRTELARDEQRRKAKAERETREPPEGESRQVRRARERREAKK